MDAMGWWRTSIQRPPRSVSLTTWPSAFGRAFCGVWIWAGKILHRLEHGSTRIHRINRPRSSLPAQRQYESRGLVAGHLFSRKGKGLQQGGPLAESPAPPRSDHSSRNRAICRISPSGGALLFHLLSKLYEQTIPDSTNRSAAYLEPIATGVDDTQLLRSKSTVRRDQALIKDDRPRRGPTTVVVCASQRSSRVFVLSVLESDRPETGPSI